MEKKPGVYGQNVSEGETKPPKEKKTEKRTGDNRTTFAHKDNPKPSRNDETSDEVPS